MSTFTGGLYRGEFSMRYIACAMSVFPSIKRLDCGMAAAEQYPPMRKVPLPVLVLRQWRARGKDARSPPGSLRTAILRNRTPVGLLRTQ